ncbi:MAG: HAD family hydrolase [Solirubrobacterales bacterium]
MMKYRLDAVLFDLDGVVIDSASDIATSVQLTMEVLNHPVRPREEIIPHVGYGAVTMLRGCLNQADEAMLEQAVPIYRQIYLQHALVETRLFPNLENVMRRMKTHPVKKTAVVTSKTVELSEAILQGLKARHYFDLIVGFDSVVKPKPDPEGILMVLDAFGAAPERTMMVGDAFTDIEAGKRAGVVTCGVTYGMGDRDLLLQSKPDLLVNDIGELLKYIE